MADVESACPVAEPEIMMLAEDDEKVYVAVVPLLVYQPKVGKMMVVGQILWTVTVTTEGPVDISVSRTRLPFRAL